MSFQLGKYSSQVALPTMSGRKRSLPLIRYAYALQSHIKYNGEHMHGELGAGERVAANGGGRNLSAVVNKKNPNLLEDWGNVIFHLTLARGAW